MKLPGEGSVHFPAAGWVVGGLACVAFALLGFLVQGSALVPLVAAMGSTVATIAVTKAAHEKAAAKFAQGLGFPAAMTINLLLLAKVSLLGVLGGQSPAGVLLALFAAQPVSRFAAAWAERRMDRRELGIALAWCMVPVGAALAFRGVAFALLAVVLSAAAAWGMKRWAIARQMEAAPEMPGTTQQACELAFYLGAAIG